MRKSGFRRLIELPAGFSWLAVVDSEKKAKLLEKLCSQFKKLGVNAQPEQLILPWDESAAASKGCVQRVNRVNTISAG